MIASVKSYDDTPVLPNTARFWRLNRIVGIKETLGCVSYPFPDPEAMEYYKQSRRELELLEEQEGKVRARYERIKALRVEQAIE